MGTVANSAFDAFFKNNDFSSPGTIFSLLLVALVGIFIFLFNAMAMRRKQLDRKIHYLSTLLNRRKQLAFELDPNAPVPENDSLAALLEWDARVTVRIRALPAEESPNPALQEEYRILGEALEQALPECRAELDSYNQLVEKPDSRWFTKLCRFQPRERF